MHGSPVYEPIDYESNFIYQFVIKYREGSCIALGLGTLAISIFISEVIYTPPIQTILLVILFFSSLFIGSFYSLFKIKYLKYYYEYKQYYCCQTKVFFKSQRYHFVQLELLYFKQIFDNKCSIKDKRYQLNKIIKNTHDSILESKGDSNVNC